MRPAFLLVPASLFRVIYGVTNKDDGNGIVRGFYARWSQTSSAWFAST